MHVRPNLGYHQDVVKGMMDASEPSGKSRFSSTKQPGWTRTRRPLYGCFAWSLRDGAVQRREALGMLGALAWYRAAG